MKGWTPRIAILGALLLVIGLVPVIALDLLFPYSDPLIPVLMSLSVAPLGAILLLIGLVLFVVRAAKR